MRELNNKNTEFLSRLKQQEHEAFCELVQIAHSALVAFARSIAGEQWAEEIVQEAWVSIYKALPDFEERSSLKTWLFIIVRNEATARFRSESRHLPLNSLDSNPEDRDAVESWFETGFDHTGHWRESPPPWTIDSPDALLQEEELKQCIQRTLEILKPEQRAVFTLRDLEQLSLAEICEILQLSHVNARVLLHRARVTLLQVIDKYQETGEC